MDLLLTEEQKMIQSTAREFAEKKLAPIALDIDKTGEFPRELFKELAAADLLGLLVSPEFGGLGKTKFDVALCLQELGAKSASFAWCVAANITAGFCLQMFGSDELKKKYLPGLCKGELIGSIAITEPGSGTNWRMALKTNGQKDGDNFIVNGSKCFISNAELADFYLTFLKTDPKPGPTSVSALVIDKGTQGFTFGKKEDKFGLRGDPTGELIFDNCKVSSSQVVGGEGAAMKIFPIFGGLDCVFQANVFYGLAKASYDLTVKYVKERIVGGLEKPLSSFEAVQGAIADITISLEALRLVACRGALAPPGPDPHIILSAKYCSEAARSIVDRAFSLHGAYGAMTDFPLERYYRDVKTLTVHKTFDYVRVTLGKMVLGVPMG